MAARTKRKTLARKRSVPATAPTPRRRRTTTGTSIAKTVDQMTHAAKSTVAGAGGFSTNPGSMRPMLGSLAGLDPEARRIDRRPRKKSERKKVRYEEKKGRPSED